MVYVESNIEMVEKGLRLLGKVPENMIDQHTYKALMETMERGGIPYPSYKRAPTNEDFLKECFEDTVTYAREQAERKIPARYIMEKAGLDVL